MICAAAVLPVSMAAPLKDRTRAVPAGNSSDGLAALLDDLSLNEEGSKSLVGRRGTRSGNTASG